MRSNRFLKKLPGAVSAGLVAGLLCASPAAAASGAADDRADHRPLCSGYLTASPVFQELPVNRTAVEDVTWHCEDVLNVTIRIDWGDGNNDVYTCWANCSGGDHEFSHVYVYPFDFRPTIARTGTGQEISVEIQVS